MLWFFHPKPPSRKETVMQVVEQKAAPVVDTQVIIIDHPRDKDSRLPEAASDDNAGALPSKHI